MSKAFVREDEIGDEPTFRRAPAPFELGGKNYLTPAGSHRLREAVAELKHERAALDAGNPDSRRELQEIDRQLRYLEESLRTAEIIPPADAPWDTVRFGATVLVRDPQGNTSRYRIVGIDEADASKDAVSWRSPIARALLQQKLGARVPFKFPRGSTELVIVGISYE